jgi:hypothetical protein
MHAAELNVSCRSGMYQPLACGVDSFAALPGCKAGVAAAGNSLDQFSVQALANTGCYTSASPVRGCDVWTTWPRLEYDHSLDESMLVESRPASLIHAQAAYAKQV